MVLGNNTDNTTVVFSNSSTGTVADSASYDQILFYSVTVSSTR